MRRRTLAAAVGALWLGGAGAGLALPQQQGSVYLLNQYQGQWQGPAEADGSSQTGAAVVGVANGLGRARPAAAIGAPEADPTGRQGAGSVYIVAVQPTRGMIDLTALSGRGYRIDGGSPGDRLGFAIASLRLAGGHPGLAIGAPGATVSGRTEAGAVYVLDLTRLRGNLDLAARHSRALVAVISGATPCAQAGYALADAGPLAGGGDAVLVGAPGDDPRGCPTPTPQGAQGVGRGAAFLIPARALRGRLDLAGTPRGYIRVNGASEGDRAGSAVSAAGPGAIMVGAPQASPLSRAQAGAVYRLRVLRPGATVSLAALPGGSTAFVGAAADDDVGFSLSTTTRAAGRRQIAELALGAPQGSPVGRVHAGSVFVVPAAQKPGTVDLSRIAKPGALAGERIDGAGAGDELGWSVAGVGDLNGDGRPDLALGAPFANSPTGQDRIDNGVAYVVYGGRDRGVVDLAGNRWRGYVAFGARNSDEAGTAVGGVSPGGTARSDLLIGAPYAENTLGPTPASGGAVYLLLGFG